MWATVGRGWRPFRTGELTATEFRSPSKADSSPALDIRKCASLEQSVVMKSGSPWTSIRMPPLRTPLAKRNLGEDARQANKRQQHHEGEPSDPTERLLVRL